MSIDRVAAYGYRVKLWALRRCLGLAMIADGLTTFFTGWKIGVTLETARKIGRLRGDRMLSFKEAGSDESRDPDAVGSRGSGGDPSREHEAATAPHFTDPGYPWEALRIAKRWSEVGDYIWLRLGNGATTAQVKRDLSDYVDDLEARRASS